MSFQIQFQTSPVKTKTDRSTHSTGGWLQRKCCEGKETDSEECEECRKKRVALQRFATGKTQTRSVPGIVHEVLGSPSQPLDATARAFMESRFNHDFSKVRVHADAKAAESARAVNALAYTMGEDIVFGAGQYAPATSVGNRLLAHELTHVVQQADGAGSPVFDRPEGGAEDAYEHEAELVANQVHGVTAPVHLEPPVLRKSTQPKLMRAPIFTSTMEICHRLLRSRVFHVSQGGLVVTADAGWDASREWQGTEAPQCGREVYSMTLSQKGLIFDSEYGSCEFSHGPFSRQWGNLPEGDYYLTIWTNNTNPNCCLRGSIVVSQESGLSGETCTRPPPGPLEILHTALDIAGLIPALGAIPDAINAGIYVIQGDWINAGISAAAMIPILGEGAIVERVAGRAVVRVTGRAVERVGSEGIAAGLREARATRRAITETAEIERAAERRLAETPRPRPRAGRAVAEALRGFTSRYFRFGNQRLILTPERMEHILTRHHPQYWNGTRTAIQTFFDSRISVEGIIDLIDQTLRANREEIIRRGSNSIYQITHTIEGRTYVLGIERAHIGQFFPR